MKQRIMEMARSLAVANGSLKVAEYRGDCNDDIEDAYRNAYSTLSGALDDALKSDVVDLCNAELLTAVRRLLGYSETMHPDDVVFAESVIARVVSTGVPDSNRGVTQGRVAPDHESARQLARGGSAAGGSS